MSLGHARPKLTHMPHILAAQMRAREARIRDLQSGRTPEHACEICGTLAPFGFNNFRTAPEAAVFACRAHRDEVAAAFK